MRAIVQRVTKASVTVNGEIVGQINKGLTVLLGVHQDDCGDDLAYMVDKVSHLRIFDDVNGVMNCSVLDVAAQILVVSQFTLMGDVRKGRRPSYSHAAKPALAEQYYLKFIEKLQALGISVATGRFQTEMSLALVNDGPVTIMLDSQKCF